MVEWLVSDALFIDLLGDASACLACLVEWIRTGNHVADVGFFGPVFSLPAVFAGTATVQMVRYWALGQHRNPVRDRNCNPHFGSQ